MKGMKETAGHLEAKALWPRWRPKWAGPSCGKAGFQAGKRGDLSMGSPELEVFLQARLNH